jgi:hypothetical protein
MYVAYTNRYNIVVDVDPKKRTQNVRIMGSIPQIRETHQTPFLWVTKRDVQFHHSRPTNYSLGIIMLRPTER